MIASGNLLLDVVDYVIDNGEGTVYGTDVFVSGMPDSPDDIVVISEYAGSHIPDNQGAQRNVQIFVRGADYDIARAKINRLFYLFDTPLNPFKTFNGRMVMVGSRTTPFQVDVDARQRTVFTFSMSMTTTRDYYDS
jgi:hypothetical protein